MGMASPMPDSGIHASRTMTVRTVFSLALAIAWAACPASGWAAPVTQVKVEASKVLQTFDGLGCGVIFYEGHITSLAARNKAEEQEKLYDAMFKDVRTDYLHLYIRHDHEPENDNSDPWTQAFKLEDFKYCEHTVAICKAA